MPITLIDYVRDSPINDGSVFNGMTVRFVDASVLFDYEGMNPTEAKNLDPKNIMGIKDNEILLNEDVLTDDDGTKETTNHELNEDRQLRGDPSLEYWEVHTALQSLANDPMHNDAIKPPEVKSMKTELKYKTFRAKVVSFDDNTGIINALIPMNSGSLDRSDEVCLPKSWEKRLPIFMKRPILVSSHTYDDLRKQIGEFVTLKVTDEGLMGTPKYYINDGNEEADWAYKLAKRGMAAFSVGFKPYEFETAKKDGDPAVTYTDSELFEISQVVVPCDREAIQNAIKSKSIDPVVNHLLEDIIKTDLPDKKEVKKQYSQEEIADEIDYLTKMVATTTLSHENLESLRRLTGSDIPDEIKDLVKCKCDGCTTDKCNCVGAKCNDTKCKCKCHDSGKSIIDLLFQTK
jgi:HK97 family phage prohead protease